MTCPLCGCPDAFPLALTAECANPACRNHVPREDVAAWLSCERWKAEEEARVLAASSIARGAP